MDQVTKKALEYLVKIPQLLLLLIASFFSGHFWVYFIQLRKSDKKGEKMLINKYTITAIGLLWNILFLFPLYLYKYGFKFEVEQSIFELLVFTIILSGFTQCIISAFLVYLKK